MKLDRRSFVAGAAALTGLGASACGGQQGKTDMYGLIGKMNAAAGQRDRLIAILLEGVSGLPGCQSYIIARDPDDETAIWITEVWDSQASHEASLKHPSVQEAIAKGRPLIAGMTRIATTTPVGGHGLSGGR